MFTHRFQLRLALVYFLIAALLGVLLRAFHLIDVPVEYRHVMHGHSHIALLGWVYLAMTTIISKLYIEDYLISKRYKAIVVITHISLLGMLFTFPFQGYALWSIIFSTLFLLVSYWFTVYFLKNVAPEKRTYSFKFIKWGLILMAVSSIGPWSLGGIIALLGSESVWYKIAIYFYLHFLYNCAFLLVLIGLLFYQFEKLNIQIREGKRKLLLRLFILGSVLSFGLSVLFATDSSLIQFLAIGGAILQLVFFSLLIQMTYQHRSQMFRKDDSLVRISFVVIAVFIFIKCLLQLITGFDYFVTISLHVLDFIIAYIHLVFLGIISLSLLLFMHRLRLLMLPKVTILLFIFGVIASELLIVIRGIGNWKSVSWLDTATILRINDWLPYISALIPLSLILVFWPTKRKK